MEQKQDLIKNLLGPMAIAVASVFLALSLVGAEPAHAQKKYKTKKNPAQSNLVKEFLDDYFNFSPEELENLERIPGGVETKVIVFKYFSARLFETYQTPYLASMFASMQESHRTLIETYNFEIISDDPKPVHPMSQIVYHVKLRYSKGDQEEYGANPKAFLVACDVTWPSSSTTHYQISNCLIDSFDLYGELELP